MMLWVLIGTACFIALMFAVGSHNTADRIGGALMTLFIGAVIVGLYILVVHTTTGASDRTPTRTVQWHTELVAMRMGSSMSGSFIFGSGSFGSSEQYIYMYRTKTGALKKGKQNAYHCTVRETNTTTPRRVYDRRYVTTFWLPWEIQMVDSAPEFIVPVGSVTYKFEIN